MIKIKLNLDNYSPIDIINFYNKGIITLEEIKDSGRLQTCFSNELFDFICNIEKTQNTIIGV